MLAPVYSLAFTSPRLVFAALRWGMVKILHSADWQMGLRARHVADVAAAVREARLAAARNVIQAANAKRVDAVVLAGDIFEDNLVDDRLVHAVLGILAECRSPVFILPGNHDALTPDAVYRRASWKQRPACVCVLEGDSPVPIPGTPAVLLAAPLRQKKGMKDPTSVWCEQPGAEGIRIGVAHGSLRIPGKHSADDFPIATDVVTRAGLDYLALGHWHGQYIHEERAAYAGAHEATKFDEPGAGQALLVEIAAKGARPDLTPVPTGTLRWCAIDLDLGQGMESEAQRVRAWVKKRVRPRSCCCASGPRGPRPRMPRRCWRGFARSCWGEAPCPSSSSEGIRRGRRWRGGSRRLRHRARWWGRCWRDWPSP